MIVHEVFAHIYEEEVKNIIVCDDYAKANYLAKCVYSSDAFAVDCLQYPITIGNKYHDSCFWRVDPETGEEIKIEPYPTEEQEIFNLRDENSELTVVIADLIGGA